MHDDGSGDWAVDIGDSRNQSLKLNKKLMIENDFIESCLAIKKKSIVVQVGDKQKQT